MKTKTIITIGREFGSGGKDIAKLLADKLEVEFYDKELIYQAAKESGVSPEIFENADEKVSNSLLYSLSMGVYNFNSTGYAQINNLPINDQLYLLQQNIIRDLSSKPCVIVGRCANYILKETANVINVFISAELEYRKTRAVETKSIAENKAESIVKKADKTRANYYNFYSDSKWGVASSYDICLNRTKFTDEQIVDVLLNFVKIKDKTYHSI